MSCFHAFLRATARKGNKSPISTSISLGLVVHTILPARKRGVRMMLQWYTSTLPGVVSSNINFNIILANFFLLGKSLSLEFFFFESLYYFRCKNLVLLHAPFLLCKKLTLLSGRWGSYTKRPLQ